jgi:hypothetical protein
VVTSNVTPASSPLKCCEPRHIWVSDSNTRDTGVAIQINATKFGLKIILLYWPTITNFVYAITFNIFQNTTKRKKRFSLKRTTFVYVISSDWWISGLTAIILYVVKTSFPWKTYHYANVKEYVPVLDTSYIFLTLPLSVLHTFLNLFFVYLSKYQLCLQACLRYSLPWMLCRSLFKLERKQTIILNVFYSYVAKPIILEINVT